MTIYQPFITESIKQKKELHEIYKSYDRKLEEASKIVMIAEQEAAECRRILNKIELDMIISQIHSYEFLQRFRKLSREQQLKYKSLINRERALRDKLLNE